LNIEDRPPKKMFLLLVPGLAIGSYLFFDIPYFLHDTFGYGYCDTGGPCTRLFDNVPQLMPWIGLSAMLMFWLVIGSLTWSFYTGRWDPTKPKGQQWTPGGFNNRLNDAKEKKK